jgi:uncharacterized protein YggT (Ycf19 family)
MLGANLLGGLGHVLDFLLNMVQLTVIASFVISWLNAPSDNSIVMMVRAITEPLYRPFQGLSRRISNYVDFSPVFVLCIIIFLQKSIVPWLLSQSLIVSP